MTREEVIKTLENFPVESTGEREAVSMAISALKNFDGMTNGEVFQAIFPNASVFENQDNEPYPYIDVFLCGDKDMNCYRKDWWCAPYKGEQE